MLVVENRTRGGWTNNDDTVPSQSQMGGELDVFLHNVAPLIMEHNHYASAA